MIVINDHASRLATEPSRAKPEDAAALLQHLTARFDLIGITRVASQTGLDRTGIPCYAAIRPNSLTIATHQGKGMDALSAQISAIMEAAEYAVAEAPETAAQMLSLAETRARGIETLDVANLLPRGFTISPDQPIRWLEGTDSAGADTAGATVLVPYDAVVLGVDPADFTGLAQSTNGIAAGTSMAAARLHALCELIERDAVVLWSFKSDPAALATAVAPQAFADEGVDALVARMKRAGCEIRLYDQTSNTGVPTIYAVMFPADGANKHFELASGAACHPIAAIAARKAIIEAAQTRVANIAGARDDIVGAEYDAGLSRSVEVLTTATETNRPAPRGLPMGTGTDDMLAFIEEALARVRLTRIITVRLGSEKLGIEVVKCFVPGLEDQLTNKHWRPGPRAAAAMMGFG